MDLYLYTHIMVWPIKSFAIHLYRLPLAMLTLYVCSHESEVRYVYKHEHKYELFHRKTNNDTFLHNKFNEKCE